MEKHGKFSRKIVIVTLTAVLFVTFFWLSGQVKAEEVDLGDFVRSGIGARSLGMGGAYVAVGGDTSSTFWNPAGITELDRSRFGGMYTDRFSAGIIYQYLGGVGVVEFEENPQTASQKLSKEGGLLSNLARYNPIRGTLGGGLTRIGMDLSTSSVGRVVGETRSLWIGSTGYKFPRGSLLNGLAVGGNVKRYNRSIDEDSVSGWGYDLGVMYRTNLGLNQLPFFGKVGFSLQDPGGVDLSPGNGEDLENTGVIPPYNRFGLAVGYNSTFPVLLGVEYDFSPTRPKLTRTNFGAEVSIVDIFYLRAGINKWASETSLNYTAGAGFDVGQFSIDYAYMPHQALGSTNVLSLDFKF